MKITATVKANPYRGEIKPIGFVCHGAIDNHDQLVVAIDLKTIIADGIADIVMDCLDNGYNYYEMTLDFNDGDTELVGVRGYYNVRDNRESGLQGRNVVAIGRQKPQSMPN